ncbi:hypothetical protein AusDCA_4458 [Desulfitobacterium sp. AusDCA]
MKRPRELRVQMRRPLSEQLANSAQTALASAGRAHGPKASGGGFRPEPQTQENISTAKGGTGANRAMDGDSGAEPRIIHRAVWAASLLCERPAGAAVIATLPKCPHSTISNISKISSYSPNS